MGYHTRSSNLQSETSSTYRFAKLVRPRWPFHPLVHSYAGYSSWKSTPPGSTQAVTATMPPTCMYSALDSSNAWVMPLPPHDDYPVGILPASETTSPFLSPEVCAQNTMSPAEPLVWPRCTAYMPPLPLVHGRHPFTLPTEPMPSQ